MSPDPTEKKNSTYESVLLSDLTDDMWKGFIKYWWIIFVFVSLMASIFYFHARYTYQPVYTSTATFTVEANRGSSTGKGTSNASYNATAAKQLGTAFPYLLKSSAMSRMVAEDLKIDYVPGTIETENVLDTNMLTLKVTTEDPYLSYDVLQSLLKNYGTVSEYLLGNITLNLVDGSGVNMWPSNLISFRKEGVKGFAVGLLIVAGFLYLYAVTRRTVKKEKDLKKILNVPCLAVMPEAKMKKRSNLNRRILIDQRHIPSFFVESVRNLRTRVIQDIKENQTDAMLVTSALAGEGKSTIASNLAIALAQRGYRVLLIDGDLRKPALARTMGLETKGKGFCDLITGTATLNEVIIPYEKDVTLAIIPGGAPAANASEMLNEGKIGPLLETLRNGTDIMIIDTPPCGVVADSAVYAKYVAGAVLVVRQDYARFNDIITGVELLNDAKLRLIGCVLNRYVAGISLGSYAYGYGYGKYGYGYGKYGYGYGAYGYGEETGKVGETVKVESVKIQENDIKSNLLQEKE